MQYVAKFDMGNYEPVALVLFFADGVPPVFSIDTYSTVGSMDVTKDVQIKQNDATMTAWLPATRFWAFVGRDRNPYLEDGAPLTAGKWDMFTKWSTSTPGIPTGAEDHCGVDDSDRVQKK
jgi:hypothetical protein